MMFYDLHAQSYRKFIRITQHRVKTQVRTWAVNYTAGPEITRTRDATCQLSARSEKP